MRWLSSRGWGFPLENNHVAPIVPAAALFDLGRGKDYIPPVGPDWGMKACAAATAGESSVGSIGAGTGSEKDIWAIVRKDPDFSL